MSSKLQRGGREGQPLSPVFSQLGGRRERKNKRMLLPKSRNSCSLAWGQRERPAHSWGKEAKARRFPKKKGRADRIY